MGIEASDVLGLLPTIFSGVKSLVSAVSPRAGVVAGFAEEIITLAVSAERDGLSQETFLEAMGDYYVDFLETLKTGVK